MEVRIWSKYKVLSSFDVDPQVEYDKFMEIQEEKGYLSSVIQVNDIDQLTSFLIATYNETDVDLDYKIL